MCSILSGKTFINAKDFVSVVRRYCLVIVEDDKKEGQVAMEQFRSKAESLLFFNSQVLCTHFKLCFKELHQSSLMSRVPMSAIFRTEREKCRFCQKSLILDGKSNVVVVYHSEFGTYLGCRISKRCKSCKVLELYGYYLLEGMRHMDDNVLKSEFLLSTEVTAIQMLLLKKCSNLWRGASFTIFELLQSEIRLPFA